MHATVLLRTVSPSRSRPPEIARHKHHAVVPAGGISRTQTRRQGLRWCVGVNVLNEIRMNTVRGEGDRVAGEDRDDLRLEGRQPVPEHTTLQQNSFFRSARMITPAHQQPGDVADSEPFYLIALAIE